MQARTLTRKPVPVVQAVLVMTILAAWLLMLALEQSPNMGHEMSHAPLPRGASVLDGLLTTLAPFTASWALMVVGMMLPAMLPIALLFSRSVAHMGETGRARWVFGLLAGYLLAWTAFGIVAHFVLQVFLRMVGPSPAVSLLLGPAALVVAGAYQFAPFKLRLAYRSCSPPAFSPVPGEPLGQRWARLLLLGVREGAVCIACCWALMSLMLLGIAGGSGGMLVLSALMYAEKNASWGRKMIMPLGLFLIGLGLILGWGTLLGVLSWHDHSI